MKRLICLLLRTHRRGASRFAREHGIRHATADYVTLPFSCRRCGQDFLMRVETRS